MNRQQKGGGYRRSNTVRNIGVSDRKQEKMNSLERTDAMKPKKQNRATSRKLIAVASEIANCSSRLLDELRTDLEFDDNPQLYVAMQLYDLVNAEYHMRRYVNGDTFMNPLQGIDELRQMSKLMREYFVEPNGRVEVEHIEALDKAVADLEAVAPKAKA